jgi:hypothetical protein
LKLCKVADSWIPGVRILLIVLFQLIDRYQAEDDELRSDI